MTLSADVGLAGVADDGGDNGNGDGDGDSDGDGDGDGDGTGIVFCLFALFLGGYKIAEVGID